MSLPTATKIVLSLIVALGIAGAQQKTISSGTRPGVSDNAAEQALEGTRPNSVLKVVKVNGTVQSIDLQKRSVTIAPSKGQPMELTFSQPAGREQLKAGKKAIKRLGKKRLRLEELTSGAKVKVRYYPLLAQLMEIEVE